MFSQFLTTILLSTCLSHAKFLTSPSEASETQYDFVVVGGGTAGSVVASRLSETSASVLLIDAGIVNAGPPESIPFDAPLLTPYKGPWDWNYTTTPQTALGSRTIPYPRGKALGGSSSVNYMIFNHGGSDDFDRMAKIANNDIWTWNSLQPYRTKLEGFVAPANKSERDMFNIDFHGVDGPLTTSKNLWPVDIDNMIINATSQLDGYPYTQDMNGGNEIGIGYVYASIGSQDGAPPNRTSGASAYIFPNINRANLDVLIETQATRILQTDTIEGVPVFKGVEFSRGPGQPVYNVTAANEVVLSAGSIGTPQILMLSGIGDKNDLAKVGIDAIVSLPDVGKNLQDHALLPLQWYANSTTTWEANKEPAVAQEWLNLYYQNGTGLLANTIANLIGWLRVPEDSDAWQHDADPSSGSTSGHYELIFTNGFIGPIQDTPEFGDFFSIVVNLVTPASRGSIRLNTSSPWEAPLINPGFMTDELDVRLMREAVKSALKFTTAPAFSQHIIEPYLDDPLQTDSDIEAYIRKYTSSVWHPVATASISPDGSNGGVVDSKLSVKKVHGVRVVDASVMPWAPAAHPEAAIYTIAETVSDIIKDAYDL